ncbi:MAG: hypothetical protein LBB21_01470 [Holosporaceae bacterium]|nr:hypothetical protein [Holosporaceae bacterium]
MKNVVTLLLLCFSILSINESAAITDGDAAASFQKVLNNETPLDIILVSRDTTQYKPIELDEIALLFACLAVSIGHDKEGIIRERLSTLIDTFSYGESLPNISSYLKPSTNMQTIKTVRKSEILAKFDEYSKGVMDSIFPETAWKIFVFNETFFSKTTPLKDKEKTEIERLFFAFLNEDNILLHINYLYTSDTKIHDQTRLEMIKRFSGEYDLSVSQIKPPKVVFKFDQSSREKMIASLEQNKTIVNEYKSFLQTLNENTVHSLLFNRSFIFYKNDQLTRYNKSTYLAEANSLLIDNTTLKAKQGALVYNIGNGKDIKNAATKYPLLAQLIVDNISSEICYDLTLGIRHSNQWKNVNQSSKLHIYTSNSSPQSKSNFFPINRTTACIDPKGSIGLLGSAEAELTLVFKRAEELAYIHTNWLKSFKYGANDYKITVINNTHL